MADSLPIPPPEFGASLNLPSLHAELIARRELLRDPHASLEDRLEAFEDIIDSEVGDTSLVRARHLEREFGLRQLYLKFEGGNPTGTQKDRIAFAQCMDALRRGYEVITVATCGNYGVAIALAGLKSVIHVPEAFHTRRITEMQTLGAQLIRIAGDYETTVEASQQAALQHDWYDGNPGGHNTMLQLQAYGEIAFEIYDELRDAPKVVAVPVSNGTVLAGAYKGFLRLFRRGKTSRLSPMVAGSALKKNPITQALLAGKATCEDLLPASIRETEVNEPLINWHSFDGDWALDAVQQTQGWVGEVSDRRMLSLSKLLREQEGIHVLSAATAGLAALLEQHQRQPLPGDRYVAVLTARK